MLSFRINQIQFDSKIILEDVKLSIPSGKLVLLVGESGSGKSTLINCLTLRNDFDYEYHIDDIDLHKLDDDEKKNFILSHMGIVYQNPKFIESLTIKDHIELIQDLCSSHDSIDEYISLLKLNNLIDQYPNNLSGGEQVRVALLLSLIKNPDIIIMDEPTSSLDEHYTELVLNILRKLVSQGKTVIISTHDAMLMKHADIIYKISNNTLSQASLPFESQYASDKCLKSASIVSNIEKVPHILSRTKKHNKVYRKVMMSLTIIAIAVSSFATQFNNAVMTVQLAEVNELSSNELIVYKPMGGDPHNDGASHGNENEVMTDEDLKAIEEIEHVQDIRWRVDILMGWTAMLPENKYSYIAMDDYKIEVTYSDGTSVERFIEESLPTLNTYFKDKNYDSDILEKFSEQGIYISRRYAEFLDEDISKLKGAKIKCDIYIPVYNSVGKAWTEDENGTSYYPTMTDCEIINIELPIAGILKESRMGLHNMLNFAVYMERDDLEKYLNEYKKTENRTVYVTDYDGPECYYNEKPTDKTALITVEEEPWTPRNYSVFIDDITAMEEVVGNISRKGFNVSNAYFEASAITNSLETAQNGIKYFSYGITAIVILIYIVIKYNNKNEEENINQYLKELGLSLKNIKTIKVKFYFKQAMTTLISAICVMSVILMILNVMRYGYTSFGIWMFVVAIALSMIIEFIVPLLIERKINND